VFLDYYPDLCLTGRDRRGEDAAKQGYKETHLNGDIYR